MEQDQHNAPCDSLLGFKKLVIATLGMQSVFVIAALSLALSTMNRVSAVAEKQVQTVERQRMIEQKADNAADNAAKALTLSGKSEADIAWIREGFTELKMMVRSAVNDNSIRMNRLGTP